MIGLAVCKVCETGVRILIKKLLADQLVDEMEIEKIGVKHIGGWLLLTY